MSKPNLPPLPHYLQKTLHGYQYECVIAYAEESVRQALAAQVPVAWMMTKRRFHSEPGFTKIDPSRVFESEYVRLAIIPENSPGHKPAPVDTSSGHSALPPLTGWSPGDFTYTAEVVTVDEAKAYATEFARKALDAAAMKIGELGQKAFEQPGVPGEVHMAYHQALVILLTHKPETRDG